MVQNNALWGARVTSLTTGIHGLLTIFPFVLTDWKDNFGFGITCTQEIFLWCTKLHRKVFYFTECSSNAQVPYDGDRIIQASAAYTCSWVITVPENYTVKLTISKNNVASVGNTNCVNDYVKVIIATFLLLCCISGWLCEKIWLLFWKQLLWEEEKGELLRV